MKNFSVLLFFLLSFFILLPSKLYAKIGVGVNTGKIQVDEKLKAGMIYKIPSITVVNTGDELLEYTVSISYHQSQPELRPQKEWFKFSPNAFILEPGKSQKVEITINLPLNIEPGNYFAYLEARPLSSISEGSTLLGVAAASKLYFTVEPANMVLGVYHKAASIWRIYSPWPQIAATVLSLAIITVFFRKFVNVEIGLRNKNSKEKKDE